MSKGFALKDLYDLIAVNSNISPVTAEKVWKNILNIIISELQYNDKITIDNFGRFDKIYEGGKDEYVTNGLGIIEKKYIPKVATIKFTPSVGFVTKLNEEDVFRLNKVSESDSLFEYENFLDSKDLEESLNSQIDIAMNRKRKRRKKEIKRETDLHIKKKEGTYQPNKNYNISQPIKCTTINKSFPSISNCANKLDLRKNNIIEVLDTDKDVFGYKFISLSKEEYEKNIKEDRDDEI